MVAPHTAPSDHDLELLSAYLDDELSDRERVSLEQRLNREVELRAALDDLRTTVAMVRDLPPLKAPRNFTLDPAIYSRPIPWWKQLFTLGAVLQLSGAVGTVAAIMMIATAFLLGGADSDETGAPEAASMQPAEPGAAALAPTITLSPLGTPTGRRPAATAFAANQATAIANANTDAAAFDATLEAQSAMYASTEIPGTMTAVAITATPQPTQTAERRLTATSLPLVEEGVGFAASGEANETPSETESYDNAEDDAGFGPPPQLQAISPSPQPEGPTMLQVRPPSDDSGVVNSAPAAETAADASAMREAESSATPMQKATRARSLTPTVTANSTPTSSPTPTPAPTRTLTSIPIPTQVSVSGEAVSDQDGQSITDESEQPAAIAPAMELRDADQNESEDATWLARLGAIILVVSLGVFVVGRRRSRRA